MENQYRPSGKEYLHVNDNRILKIDKEYIGYLKSLAKKDSSGKCMMCLHNDTRAYIHELVSVYPAGVYLRPHSHPNKTESTTLIEGKLQVIIFDEFGEILDEFIAERDGIFTFRLDKGIIHAFVPVTDIVFYEAKNGPFVDKKTDAIFPKWTPEPQDTEKVAMYMKEVESKLRKYRRSNNI